MEGTKNEPGNKPAEASLQNLTTHPPWNPPSLKTNSINLSFAKGSFRNLYSTNRKEPRVIRNTRPLMDFPRESQRETERDGETRRETDNRQRTHRNRQENHQIWGRFWSFLSRKWVLGRGPGAKGVFLSRFGGSPGTPGRPRTTPYERKVLFY